MKGYQIGTSLIGGCLLAGLSLSAGAAESDPEPTHHEADSFPVTHTADTSLQGKPLAIDAGGVAIQFGGFVKVDYMQDLDYIGNSDQFKVNSIPVPPDPNADRDGSSNIMARSTRFSLDVRGSGDNDDGLRAYVEGDFFGSGNSFRVRHAYGEWNGILGGQTWSTFQDISARPFTLDYEGPDAEIFVRQAMIRYTGRASDNMQWSIALEDPESQVDVQAPVTGSGRNDFPDVAGNIRFTGKSGHVQIAGLLRQIRFEGSDVEETTTGYGLNVSGKANVFGSDAIMGHLAFGSGISRYIEAFGGTNSDAVLTTDGDLDALDGWALVAGYTHHWNAKMNSTLSLAFAEVDNDPAQDGDAMKASSSMHVNFVYTPIPRLLTGVELMWGERENSDGSTGDAVRLQFSLQYKFR